MITSYKGRALPVEGQAVEVYFHFPKKMFSIRDKKTGLVVAHSETVLLQGVTYKVKENDRERVREEQVKNVHATIEGTFLTAQAHLFGGREGYYNPYTCDSFIDKESGQALWESDYCYCIGKQFRYK